MNEEVRKAGDDLRAACGDGSFEMSAVRTADVFTVLEALRDQEAEVARLNAAWDSAYKQAMQNGESAQVQRARAEMAGALLREAQAIIDDYLPDHPRDAAFNVSARITAHLGGENND